MKRFIRFGLVGVLFLGSALFLAETTDAQSAAGRPGARQAQEAANQAGGDDFTAQDREAMGWATEFASECTHTLERWLASNAITEEQLFSRLYIPVPKTDPPKFTTDYDSLADRDLPAIQEKFIGKSTALMYAVLSDINGYVPTHNQRYAQPLTGNRAVDLVNNRTKRIFVDRTGFAAARSEAPHLLQRYARDTGERMIDLSIPIRIRGKHWGCIRLGYRQIEK